LTIPYFILTKRPHLLYYLALGSIMSIVWVYLNQNLYSYNHDYLTIANLSTLPLFGWAIGLLGMQMLFHKLKKSIKIKGFTRDFLLFSIPYWILLIAAETIFYHLFNIHDIATAGNPGLPICDCMHSPLWMKAVYFGMGPAFFVINRINQAAKAHIRK